MLRIPYSPYRHSKISTLPTPHLGFRFLGVSEVVSPRRLLQLEAVPDCAHLGVGLAQRRVVVFQQLVLFAVAVGGKEQRGKR